jgi:hypothetical protein
MKYGIQYISNEIDVRFKTTDQLVNILKILSVCGALRM